MLHDEGVALFWPGIEPVGRNDCISLGLLDSSVTLPFQAGYGVEFYPTIYDKAACLFHSLIANHPFNNGNKRTGVLALDQFLLANDEFLLLTQENMKDLAEETASYNQRGQLTPKEMMAKIEQVVRTNTFSLKKIESRNKRAFDDLMSARDSIRNSPLNSPTAVTRQVEASYRAPGR